MAPAFLLVVIGRIKGGDPEQVFPEWLALSSYVLLLLFPITLAYVIVVQRAMDVRVVVRQGLQYALAKGGIRALRLAIGTALGLAILYLWGPHRPELARAVPPHCPWRRLVAQRQVYV
jgi:sigma-B regulation protein RsbU (phosphoserine phosphatase)